MASQFNFETVLKPTYGSTAGSKFPDDESIGVKLKKAKDKDAYELMIRVSEPLARKYKMLMGGQVVIKLSECSGALKIIYANTSDLDFNGYVIRPLGTYKTAPEKKKIEGKPVAFSVTATIKGGYINKAKTREFKMQFVPVLFGKQTSFVADISKLPITVKK